MSCGEIRCGLRINAAGQSSQKRLLRDSVTDSSAFYNRLETLLFFEWFKRGSIRFGFDTQTVQDKAPCCGPRLQHIPAHGRPERLSLPSHPCPEYTSSESPILREGHLLMTLRLTAAQATVTFLKNQFSERDGRKYQFLGGCLGIFGHGNVAGIGQALEQDLGLRYYLFRNEQGMVHAACGFAKASFRMRTLVCTTSIGPGATNMVTGAAVATVNRLPVLLLPGDIFARRNVAPVLQQLESPATQDISVNDCFKPVSRYWDRIERPEQLLTSLPEAMRVLTSPADTGAVTISFPQDVQAEAFDFPEEFFEQQSLGYPTSTLRSESFEPGGGVGRGSKNPLIVAGGGVLYSEASEALSKFASATGIPVCETQAGKGSLPFDHSQQLGRWE